MITVQCTNCSKDIQTYPSRLKKVRAEGFFCNHHCQGKFRSLYVVGPNHYQYQHDKVRSTLTREERRNNPEKFWKLVDKKETGCWEWTGYKHKQGYGRFNMYPRQRVLTHRLAWELTNGVIPAGMDVCHKCDNPPCVNPKHLFLGDHQTNMNDMKKKDRNPKGSRMGMAKLNEEKIRLIREEYSLLKTPHSAIAQKYGIDKSGISRIVNYKVWKHVV